MITAPRVSATAAALRPQALATRRAYGHAAGPAKLLGRMLASSRSSASGFAASESQTTLFCQTANLPVSRLISPYTSLPLTRSFHVSTPQWKQQRNQKGAGSDKRSGREEQKGPKSEEKKGKAKEGKEGEGEQGEGKEEGKEDGKEGEGKKDAPPPPHGDKSPWQVFTETLQSEFKASKEWNESRKALASSAHQFTENENIKRARAAYEAASGAATTRTSSAFKHTGQAIGKGAAWTWNTPVVKGVRMGVNATGTGFEKATRPVRETEAYKSAVGGVRDAIDDGSSSRYGGWIEKEERRKQRKQREEMAARAGRGGKVEKAVEDPE